MLSRKSALATLLFLLLPGLTATADPVVPKHLAKDARWYVHLDFAAAKQTVLYATLLDVARTQFPVDDTLAQIKQFLGVDLLNDITGVTAYNTSFEKDVAALIFYTKGIDRERLTNALAQNGDYQETPYNKRTLLSWTDNNDHKHKTACFHDNGIVLMADKEETLKMAVDVLDGARPGESPLIKAPPPAGAFVYASADLARADDRNVSQLLSNSEAATASLGETGGRLALNVHVTARNAETGAQIRKMLDGVKAFAELATARDYPTATALLRDVQLTADGTHIAVTVTHDAKTLLQTLQKLDAEHKAKQANPAEAEKPQGL